MDVDFERLYVSMPCIMEEQASESCRLRCEAYLRKAGVKIDDRTAFLVQVLALEKANFHSHNPRRRIVRMLWASNLWREPWTSLVNQELPGDNPPEINAAEQSDQAEAMCRDMWQLLHKEGYTGSSKSELTVYELSLTALLRELDVPTHKMTMHKEAADIIRRSGHAHHPAWDLLLNRFFPRR